MYNTIAGDYCESVTPDPIRTRKLSLSAPMVLCLKIWEVGHCRHTKFFMKIKNSLKSIKKRDLNSKLVRRRGRVYIINKTNPKFKARQK